jgi:hypothetical protein
MELQSQGANQPILNHHSHAILVKVLQGWKLNVLYNELQSRAVHDNSIAVSELVLLTMALVAISTDSSQMGSSELNKALEIELG